MSQIRVLLVDDHPMIRRGIQALLARTEQLVVCGEANNGIEALQLIGQQQPDIVLVDILMPQMDGLETTRRIRKEHPHVRVIALTSVAEDQMIMDMIQAGASGYLLKDAPLEQIAQIITVVADGYTILTDDIARQLTIRAVRPTHPAEYDLTDREMDVLRELVDGKTNSQIAAALIVSKSTVKTHMASIFRKLDVTSRTEAVALAQGRGLA